MPRPISWLPRLHIITRTIANSVRSHYDRRDLQTLFELQPRAAQKLLELLPSVQIGTSKLIDREVLSAFLERVRQNDDIGQLIAQIRLENAPKPLKKIRSRISLVRHDLPPATLDSLPESIRLTPGNLAIVFETVEQLAEALLALARVLENDGDAFTQTYETPKPAPDTVDANALRAMYDELKEMERQA